MVNSKVEVADDKTFLKFEKGLMEPGLAKPDLFYKKEKCVEITGKPGGKFWKYRGRYLSTNIPFLLFFLFLVKEREGKQRPK